MTVTGLSPTTVHIGKEQFIELLKKHSNEITAKELVKILKKLLKYSPCEIKETDGKYYIKEWEEVRREWEFRWVEITKEKYDIYNAVDLIEEALLKNAKP